MALILTSLIFGCQPESTTSATRDTLSQATVAPPDATADAVPHGRFSPPGAATLAYPVRAAAADDGVLYVSDPDADAVFGYLDGRRVVALTELDRPLGVAVHAGRLFVGSAGRGAVEVYDLDARAWVGDLGAGPGEVARPNAIAVAPDGVIYVADSDRDQVAVFDAASYARIGTLGGPGELRFPVAVAADAARVVVADQGNHRLRFYDRDGRPTGTLGQEVPLTATSTLAYRGGFTRLQGVALWRGEVFALDAHHGTVQVFDRDGDWRAFVGRRGDCATCVALALDVQVTPGGRLVVTDPERGRWVDVGPAAFEEAP